MKRIIPILLCLALLCGCVQEPAATTAPPPSQSQPPATTAAPTEGTTAPPESLPTFQAPMVSIALPLAHRTETAEDGTLIYKGTYQNVSPIFQEPEIAEKVTLDLLNRIDYGLSDAESVLAAARSAYPGDPEGWNPYLYSVIYTPERIDSGILSLLGQHISATNQAHPTHALVAVTYDLVTGEVLTFRDLVTEEFSAPELKALLLAALEPQKENLYHDYETAVDNLFARDLEQLTNWYLSANGLCFYFEPYSIASYVVGTVVAEIPYGSLGGILRNDYFPAERGTPAGKLTVEPFDTADRDRFSSFAEVIVDRDGSRYLLSVEGAVLDLSIVQGSKSGDYFLPEGTIFAASSLSQGDAIMIQADPEAEDQVLQITYTSGENQISEFITLP